MNFQNDMPHFYQKKDVQEILYIKDARENKAAEIYLMTIIFLSTVSILFLFAHSICNGNISCCKVAYQVQSNGSQVEIDGNKVRKIS